MPYEGEEIALLEEGEVLSVLEGVLQRVEEMNERVERHRRLLEAGG